jgi:hypothetical protein
MMQGTQRFVFLSALATLATVGAAACGGATPVPSSPTTTTNATIEKTAPREAEPAKAEPAQPAAELDVASLTSTSKAEPCEARLWWTCVTVPLEGARKVEKRETLLIGDPAFAETRSGTTDGRNPITFTTASGDVVSIALRRKGGHKNEIVLRTGKSADRLGAEVIVDRHDGDDFQYVSIVATEQNGKAYVDVRYMR